MENKTDNTKITKPRMVLTRLNSPLSTGESFRIDDILDITLPYNLPYKSGDYLTSEKVDLLFASKQFKFIKINAPEIGESIEKE
jgi:hypothetical protein